MASTYTLRLEVEGKDKGAASMLDALKGDMTGAGDAASSMGAKIAGGFKSAEGAAASLGEKITASMKSAGSALQGFGTKMSVGVTAPILGFAAAAIKGAADAEQLEVSFTTMLGSAEKAQTLIAQLSQFAATTPFETPEIANAGKQLLAFGVAADDIIPTLTKLGDISAGLNIPLGDMAYLFGTNRAQGKLMTGDLNQLASRGVPIIAALAKTMGVAESAIKDMASQGKISFKDFEKALDSMTEKGGQFSGLMAAQSGTFSGLLSTLSDNVGLTMTAIGKAIIEGFDLKGALTTFIGYIDQAKNAIIGLAQSNPQLFKMGLIFAGIAAAVGPVAVGLGTLLTVLAPLGPALAVVGSALAALVGPLGLVVVGIGVLVALNWDTISSGLSTVGSALYNFGQYLHYVVVDHDDFNGFLANLPTSVQPAAKAVGDFVLAAIDMYNNLGPLSQAIRLVWVDSALLSVALSVVPANLQGVVAPILGIVAGASQLAGQLENLARVFTLVWTNSAFLGVALAVLPANLQGVLGPIVTLVASAGDLYREFGNIWRIFALVASNSAFLGAALTVLPTSLQGVLAPVLGLVASLGDLYREFGSVQGILTLVGIGFQTLGAILSTSLTAGITAVQTAWAGLAAFFGPSIERIQTAFGSFLASVGTLGPSLTALSTAGGAALTALGQAFTGLWSLVQPVLQGLGIGVAVVALTMSNLLAASIQNLVPIVNAVIGELTAVVNAFAGIVSGNVALITAVINGDWAGAWTAFQSIVTSALGLVQATLSNFFAGLSAVVAIVGTTVSTTLQDLGFTEAAADIQAATTAVQSFIEWLGKIVSGQIVVGITVPDWITNLLAWTWPTTPEWLSSWTWPRPTALLSWSFPSPSALYGWSWPTLPGWSWPTLPGWTWPSLPTFKWPTLPTWTWPTLPTFKWPSLPTWKWPDIPTPGWLSSLLGAIGGNGPSPGGAQDPMGSGNTGARGKSFWRGGNIWVGEEGPEMVNLPRGAQIIPHQESMALAGGDTIILQPTIYGDIDLETFFYRFEDFRRRKRRP